MLYLELKKTLKGPTSNPHPNLGSFLGGKSLAISRKGWWNVIPFGNMMLQQKQLLNNATRSSCSPLKRLNNCHCASSHLGFLLISGDFLRFVPPSGKQIQLDRVLHHCFPIPKTSKILQENSWWGSKREFGTTKNRTSGDVEGFKYLLKRFLKRCLDVSGVYVFCFFVFNYYGLWLSP